MFHRKPELQIPLHTPESLNPSEASVASRDKNSSSLNGDISSEKAKHHIGLLDEALAAQESRNRIQDSALLNHVPAAEDSDTETDSEVATHQPPASEKLFNVPITEHTSQGWSQLWQNGQTPWDRGQPSPALVELLRTRSDLVGNPFTEYGRRRRVLVPGCGNGYDVILFALMGFEAHGLEISPGALESARTHVDQRFEEYKEKYGEAEEGAGSYDFLEGDYFQDRFIHEAELWGVMDIIYDYTASTVRSYVAAWMLTIGQFFCAFPPERRRDVAKRHAELVAERPGTRLICLEFPLSKHPKQADDNGNTGPPFGLSSDTYLAHFGNPAWALEYTDDGYPDEKYHKPGITDSTTRPFIRIAHIKPRESHFKSDRISVWHHIAMHQD